MKLGRVVFILTTIISVLNALPIASVFVMRHCARAPSTTWTCGKGYSSNPNDYSSQKWPDFPVPTMECTPRGLEIVTGQGENWKSTIPLPVAFVSDDVQRDKDTTAALAKGLGISNPNITVSGYVFSPSKYGICPALTHQQQEESLQNQFKLIQKPDDYDSLVNMLQNVLGTGVEPPLKDMPNVIENGYFDGGICVAHQATETFLLQQGAGMQVGWGKLSEHDLYDVLKLNAYWFEVCFGAFKYAQNTNSNLLYHVVKSLQNVVSSPSKYPATTYYVGHDTNIEGIGGMLGLKWNSPPYPVNTTAPGSALRFDVYHGVSGLEVHSSFVSTPFSTTRGHLTVTPATYTNSGSNKLPVGTFINLANNVIDARCVKV
eukprot:TRINITY_DN4044_c0_g1_i1.p1 TRINITY_DN4044_c0_g1~~TRINITY_DN4044_c0_g1_i1.p1  ORF type:complete len:374 (-),score=93.82 TRINITY_DN4044_c0_g1_i1:24-1145(-)